MSLLMVSVYGRMDFVGKGNIHFFFSFLLEHSMKVFSESAE